MRACTGVCVCECVCVSVSVRMWDMCGGKGVECMCGGKGVECMCGKVSSEGHVLNPNQIRLYILYSAWI